MILTLAFRNLFHDSIRLIVTIVGILFAIVLVAVQLGLYYGSAQIITDNIDHAKADLWITSFGASSFEDGNMTLTQRERHQALATPGVKAVIPLVVSFSEWRLPQGGTTRVVIVGSDPEDGGLAPWSLVQGSWADVKAPDGIAVDTSYLDQLGIKGIGDTAQINTSRVRVAALTDGVRSFTQSPYAYMPVSRARALMGAGEGRATYFLIQLEPGADPAKVKAALNPKLEDAEVLTPKQFHDRSLTQWLFKTGAGVALIGGALLGSLVGTVIVAQTLYSSTKDHLNEFATLRALGSSSGYIHRVILAQAAMSATIGYTLGMAIALVVVYASRSSPLPILMSPGLAAALFVLTLSMCAISALSAIVKVTRIDPAVVFNR